MTYTNRDGKPFSELLVKLAMMSPRAYATLIRERNEALLAEVEKLEPYVGMPLSRAYDDCDMDGVNKGCPHCSMGDFGFSCTHCTWIAAENACAAKTERRGLLLCAAAVFPSGHSLVSQGLRGAGDAGAARVEYTTYRGYVHLRPGTDVLTRETVDGMKAFLQDHVDWTRLECWGSECPADMQENTGSHPEHKEETE